VRDELRRLGYLDSGLERFVLAGAGAVCPLRTCGRVAVRLGLVGGVLFGLALSLAASGVDSRLLASSADLAVLSLYLVVLMGTVTALAALGGGLASAWFGRRGRTPPPELSRNIGLALSLAALAYLALWWRSYAGDASLAFQLTVPFVGLGLSLALGRFGAMASVAVVAAGGIGARLPQAGLSRRRVLPLLAAAGLLFGAGVSAAAYFAAADGEPPDFAVVPSDVRARLLGIDGLDPRMVDQMIARREMPRLAAVLKAGARARMRVEPERVPALVWTTIATGREPEAQGVLSAGARGPAAMRAPWPFGAESRMVRMAVKAADLLRLAPEQVPSAVLRAVKTFWSVASERGLRVGVVNWRATWPAEAVNGYLVSDRTFFRLERGGASDREVTPPHLFTPLRQAGLDGEPDRARRLDLFAVETARRLRGSHPPDLEAVYLPGLDIATMQQLGGDGGSDLATMGARLDAVRSYYRFTDGLIGRAVEELEPGQVLILVGDPGRLARQAAAAAEGMLVLIGGPAVTVDLGTVSERDIAPTLLHLAGLPVSRELPGSPVEAAFGPAFRRSHPVRTIMTYGRRPVPKPADGNFDREMLDELRSLGYVQ